MKRLKPVESLILTIRGSKVLIASRLQKLGDGQFSFAFTKKGMDNEEWYNDFRIINVPIRGLSKNEFVYVLKSEFIKLSEVEKKKLRPVLTSMKKKT